MIQQPTVGKLKLYFYRTFQDKHHKCNEIPEHEKRGKKQKLLWEINKYYFSYFNLFFFSKLGYLKIKQNKQIKSKCGMKNCEKLKRKKWKKIIIYKYKYKK